MKSYIVRTNDEFKHVIEWPIIETWKSLVVLPLGFYFNDEYLEKSGFVIDKVISLDFPEIDEFEFPDTLWTLHNLTGWYNENCVN